MGESSNRSKSGIGFKTVTSLGISSREAAERYDRLQEKLIPLWKSIRSLNQEEQTIVVVPSMTLDNSLGSIEQAYEERFLFLLFLLRQPNARLIYVTSMPVQLSIVDYYLGLLPGVIATHARKRLFLMSPADGSSRPLIEKILERPRFIQKIRANIPDCDRAHLVPFNTTILERDLALRLGIPMYGADPKFFHFGSKSGCRKVFAEEGVPHPVGYENLTGIAQVVEAICKIRVQRRVKKVILKLNEGVSGEGNATVDLEGLPAPGSAQEPDAVASKLRRMQMESTETNFKTYIEKLAHRGGIVEEMIVADEVRSPSVQMRVTPLGELEILSTHDQLLGGRGGQSYLGAKFPADVSYANLISHEAAKIGKRLAKEGVIGRFAVDFLVVRSGDQNWKPYAIEINLRKGGTTHPFLTLQFLTNGVYDPETGIFTTSNGTSKYLVASDHVKSPKYRSLTVDDLFELAVRSNLHFDHTRQTGVVFHMMSALPQHGRTGLTAIANSHDEAYALYQRAVSALDQEAETSLTDSGLPD
jgi:PGM1 C-terminal domain